MSIIIWPFKNKIKIKKQQSETAKDMSKLSDVDSRQNSNLSLERFSIRPVHELLLEEGIPFLTINDKENVKRK